MDIRSVLTATKPTFTKLVIGPEQAQTLLDANTRNRNMRDATVDGYARDMKGGRWLFNGDAIRISKTGRILDGQHRLSALIKAGVTLEFLIVSGLDDEAQDTIDVGRKRTAADALKLNGETDVMVLSAIVGHCWMWDRGNRRFSRSAGAPSTMEIREFLSEHPELRRAAEHANAWHHKFKGYTKTMYGTGYWVLGRIDHDEALWFMQGLSSGADLKETDPLYVLRQRLISDRMNNRTLTNAMLMGYLVKTWNAMRSDTPMKRILHTASDNVPEPI